MKKIYFTVALATVISITSSAQSFDLNASMERGKTVYLTYCLSCHMMEGEGIENVNPPLVKNKNLQSKERMVQVVLKGMRGPLTVNSKTYNTEMAPTVLSDEETADVLNYMRNSWGNKAAPVLPKDIQPALKVKLKDYTAF